VVVRELREGHKGKLKIQVWVMVWRVKEDREKWKGGWDKMKERGLR